MKNTDKKVVMDYIFTLAAIAMLLFTAIVIWPRMGPAPGGEQIDIEYSPEMVTTISQDPATTDTPWKISFDGEDSISISTMLLQANYADKVNKSIADFTVTTELSEEPYELSLTGLFVRQGVKQATLSQEQSAKIQEILERHLEPGTTLFPEE